MMVTACCDGQWCGTRDGGARCMNCGQRATLRESGRLYPEARMFPFFVGAAVALGALALFLVIIAAWWTFFLVVWG